MAEIGADPHDLRSLAKEFRTAERRLDHTSRTIARLVRNSDWHGRDAERFRQRWSGPSVPLRNAAAGLREAAEELDGHVTEQVRASEAEATPGTPGAGPRATGSVAPVASISRPVEAGPPPLGEPLPLRAESWQIGGGLAAGWGGRGTTAVTVESLPGERSLVWLENASGLYLTAGVGAGVGLDDGPGVELGASVSAGADLVERRGWQVADEDLRGLLFRLGGNEALDRIPALGGSPIPGMPELGSLPFVGGLFDAVGLGGAELGSNPFVAGSVDRAAGAVGVGVPDPTIADRVFSLDVEGGPEATLGLPLAGATAMVATQVGLRTRGEDRSVLFHTAGGWDTDRAGKGPSGSTRTTIELPVVEGTTQPVIVTAAEAEHDVATIHRRIVEFDRSSASAAVREAAAALADGDPDGAAAHIAELVDGIDATPVWQDAALGTFDDDVHDLDVGAALGPRFEGTVTGGRTVIDYGR